MTRYFYQPQYFECKQADIEWINNNVSKKYCLKIFRPERGGGGVERVYISGFHIHVAMEMYKWGFKGLLHALMNPIFFFNFSFT